MSSEMASPSGKSRLVPGTRAPLNQEGVQEAVPPSSLPRAAGLGVSAAWWFRCGLDPPLEFTALCVLSSYYRAFP